MHGTKEAPVVSAIDPMIVPEARRLVATSGPITPRRLRAAHFILQENEANPWVAWALADIVLLVLVTVGSPGRAQWAVAIYGVSTIGMLWTFARNAERLAVLRYGAPDDDAIGAALAHGVRRRSVLTALVVGCALVAALLPTGLLRLAVAVFVFAMVFVRGHRAQATVAARQTADAAAGLDWYDEYLAVCDDEEARVDDLRWRWR